jgi:acetoin utilization deacetylase AcuC-like enzyme
MMGSHEMYVRAYSIIQGDCIQSIIGLCDICRCCKGRIVSVLEGGYNLRGGLVSAFARSVASHVRALADGSKRQWDPADSEVRAVCLGFRVISRV